MRYEKDVIWTTGGPVLLVPLKPGAIKRARDRLVAIALKRAKGSRTDAAKMLGLSRQSFSRMVNR